jgi:hypothetical protein
MAIEVNRRYPTRCNAACRAVALAKAERITSFENPLFYPLNYGDRNQNSEISRLRQDYGEPRMSEIRM